ncbi:SDR family oxidoreductase [Thermogutta sp.]|uniref:SDR family oxidoreductase n=1 Tax=Thermogutta sp. TaxID=1962930 RepID=UPI003C7E0945
MARRIVVGTGYVGLRIAKLWQQQGDEVYGVTRSPAKARTLAELGLKPIIADVLDPPTLADVPYCDTLVYSVGPGGQSQVSRFALYRDGLRTVLSRWGDRTARIVLVSSTGVYGDSDTEVVDESTPRKPLRESSQALAEAEDLLLAPAWRDKAVITRMGGIYGPGRLPLLRYIRARQPLPTDPDALLNLIFADDAARAVVIVADAAEPPEVVNVVDGRPVTRRQFYEKLCQCLGLPPPTFSPSSQEVLRLTRAVGSARPVRIISNRRLIDRYQMSFLYPDYERGIEYIVASGREEPD